MLEADLEHYYRKDLRFEFESIGCRRLWAFVMGLPPDSAVRRDGKQWRQGDELTAIFIERMDSWMRLLAIGQGRKPNQVAQLPRIKHPDRSDGSESEARERMASGREINSFIQRLRR